MFELITGYPTWSWLIIGTGAVACSELLWLVYNHVGDSIKRHQSEVNEVLMFNELGFACVQEHRTHSQAGRLFRCPNAHCSQRHIQRIVAQLDRAKYSIDLAMYTLSLQEVVAALKSALTRKVSVRIIVSRRPDTPILLELITLMRCGAQLRSQNDDGFMHHKYCVIDGPARVKYLWALKKHSYAPQTTYSVSINGSLNWSQGGFGANWEDVVISSHPMMISEFEAEFERMWHAFTESNTQKTAAFTEEVQTSYINGAITDSEHELDKDRYTLRLNCNYA